MLGCTRAGGGDFLASIRPTTPSLTCVYFLKTRTPKLLSDGIRGCFRKTVVLKCSWGYNWYALRFGSQLPLTLPVARASCDISVHRLRGKGYAPRIEGTLGTFQYLERFTAARILHTVREPRNFQKNMIALRKRIESLECSPGKNRKWNFQAIAKDLGLPLEVVKNSHPGEPQFHDLTAIALELGIDLRRVNDET
jgi:hypothetical protein